MMTPCDCGPTEQMGEVAQLKLADLASERWILPPPDTMHGAGVPKLFATAAPKCHLPPSQPFQFTYASGWSRAHNL